MLSVDDVSILPKDFIQQDEHHIKLEACFYFWTKRNYQVNISTNTQNGTIFCQMLEKVLLFHV